MGTITSAGNGLWSAGATWVGGVVPANNDVVIIATGHVVEFDVDQSGFADGIDGITITGTLSLTRTAGTYYLKVKAGKTIAGAGTFDCGTSGSIIPFAAKHTIRLNGASSTISGTGGLTVTVYAAEPIYKFARLTAPTASADTVLHIDTDLTGDLWSDGDELSINSYGLWTQKLQTIATGGISANTLTLTASAGAVFPAKSIVSLRSRNLVFSFVGLNSGFRGFTLAGKLTIAGGAFMQADHNVIEYCSNFDILGGAFILQSATINVLYFCSNVNISNCIIIGVWGGSNKNISISSGMFIGANGPINFFGGVISGGEFACSNYPLAVQATAIVGGIVRGNISGLANSSAEIKNTQFFENTNDIVSSKITAYNCLFASTNENITYTAMAREVYSESIDHDQVSGAYKAWTRGGVTSTQAVTVPTGFTQAMQTVLENAAVEGYWQKEIAVGAGASVNITSYLRKAASMAYLPRVIVFNKASADPFAGGAGLHTFTMTDSIDTWESDLYTYTNSGTADVTLVIRTQGMAASGSVYSLIDVEQINVDLTTALAGIAAIKAKTDPITYTIANQIDANALSGGTSEAQIRAAVGLNAANLDTQLSGIPAAVWAVATSTLTAAGTIGKYIMDLIAGVWAYVSRTLTQTSAQVQAAMSGSTLTIQRGDTFTASLTGLGNISTRTKLYFTVKGNKSDLDSGAIIQLEETAGLTILNGAAYTTVTDGSIVVTDAVTGALTITLKPDVTKTLAGNGLYYDLQIVTATGVTTITAATCNVVEDVTRAVS